MTAKTDNLLIPAYCKALSDRAPKGVEFDYAMSPHILKNKIQEFIDKHEQTDSKENLPTCTRIICSSGSFIYPHVCTFELRKMTIVENDEEKTVYSLLGLNSVRPEYNIVQGHVFEDKVSYFDGAPSLPATVESFFSEKNDFNDYDGIESELTKNKPLIRYSFLNTGLQASATECIIMSCAFLQKLYKEENEIVELHKKNVNKEIKHEYKHNVNTEDTLDLLPLSMLKYSQSCSLVQDYFKKHPDKANQFINKKGELLLDKLNNNKTGKKVYSWMADYEMGFLSGERKKMDYPRTLENKRMKLLGKLLHNKSSFEENPFYTKTKRNRIQQFFFNIKMFFKKWFVY